MSCAGVDAIVTNRVWTAMGLDPGDHAARRALPGEQTTPPMASTSLYKASSKFRVLYPLHIWLEATKEP